jgi:hypothetical protein
MPPVNPTRITLRCLPPRRQSRQPRGPRQGLGSIHGGSSFGSLGSFLRGGNDVGGFDRVSRVGGLCRRRGVGRAFAAFAVVLGPCGLGLGRCLALDPVACRVDLEVLAVLGGEFATLSGLLDRQADAAAGEVEIDDLDPQLLAGGDDLLGAVDVVRGHLRDVHESLDTFADLDECAELHELGDPAVDELLDLVALGKLLPRVLLGGLERQADALTAEVDVEDLHLDRIADGDHGTGMVDVLPRELADVDEPVHAAEVDECAEADDRGDRSLADFAHLEVVEELVAGLLLVLFQVGATRQDHVVAVLVEFDDLAVHGLADVRREVADTAQLDERCGQEAAQADVDDETALDDLDDRTGNDLVGLLLGLDVAPRTLVLRTLLRQQQAAFLVLHGEDQGFDPLAERHDLGRIDVVADAQLAREDHALGLVADVEEHFVLVDLDHGAVDELAVLDGDHGAVDRIGERHAEVVGDDLAGGVRALFVEGSHLVGGRLGGGCGVGQGTNCFRNGRGLMDRRAAGATQQTTLPPATRINFPEKSR